MRQNRINLVYSKIHIFLCVFLFIFVGFNYGYCGEDSLIISNLRAEENPKCAVTYFIRWDTNKPATTEVYYGLQTDSQYASVRRSEALTTEHEVLLLGLTPQSAYKFIAKSVDAAGQVAITEENVFTTSAIPPEVNLPGITINVYNPQRAQNGWTLFDLKRADLSPIEGAMIVDMEGNIIWYQLRDYYSDIEMLDNNNILVLGGAGHDVAEINLSGEVVWGADYLDDVYTHHDVDIVADGKNFLCLRGAYERMGGYNIEGALIQEWPKEKVEDYPIWEWNSFGAVDAHYAETHQGSAPDWKWISEEYAGDWLHANALSFDEENQVVYMNAFFTGQVYKIDYNTGKVLWSFGPDGDFKLTKGKWFLGAHDPEILSNGNILLFDNHSQKDHLQRTLIRYLDYLVSFMPPEFAMTIFNPDSGSSDFKDPISSSPNPYTLLGSGWAKKLFPYIDNNFARAVEYKIDEKNMTAEQVWEYGYEQGFTFVTGGWGDADRLLNGNTLITDGCFETSDWVTPNPLLFEVTNDAQKVWELELTYGWGIYKSQRIVPLWQPSTYLGLGVLQNGKLRFNIHNLPKEIGEEIGSPVASDDEINIEGDVQFVTTGDFDGDLEHEIAFIVQEESSQLQKFIIYESTDQVGGDIGQPVFSHYSETFSEIYNVTGMSAGKFGQDLKEGVALILENRQNGSQKCIVRLDSELSEESYYTVIFPEEGEVMQYVAAGNFVGDGKDKIAILVETEVEGKTIQKIRFYGYDESLQRWVTEAMIACAGETGTDSEITHITAGDWENDGVAEIFVICKTRKADSSTQKLIVYDTPGKPISPTLGIPLATYEQVGVEGSVLKTIALTTLKQFPAVSEESP